MQLIHGRHTNLANNDVTVSSLQSTWVSTQSRQKAQRKYPRNHLPIARLAQVRREFCVSCGMHGIIGRDAGFFALGHHERTSVLLIDRHIQFYTTSPYTMQLIGLNRKGRQSSVKVYLTLGYVPIHFKGNYNARRTSERDALQNTGHDALL